MEPNWLKRMFARNQSEVAMWPPTMKALYEEQTGKKLPNDPRIEALTAERDQLRRELAAAKTETLLDMERLFLLYHMDVAARLCKAAADRLKKEAT